MARIGNQKNSFEWRSLYNSVLSHREIIQNFTSSIASTVYIDTAHVMENEVVRRGAPLLMVNKVSQVVWKQCSFLNRPPSGSAPYPERLFEFRPLFLHLSVEISMYSFLHPSLVVELRWPFFFRVGCRVCHRLQITSLWRKEINR